MGPQAQGRTVSFRAVGERWNSILSEWSTPMLGKMVSAAHDHRNAGLEEAAVATASTQEKASFVPDGDPKVTFWHLLCLFHVLCCSG